MGLENSLSYSKKKLNFYILLITSILLLIMIFIFLLIKFNSPTGLVSLEVGPKYLPGEKLQGLINFNFKQGELIPLDTKLVVEIGNQTKQFFLSNLIIDHVVFGDYYAEGSSVSGSGEGYGVLGEKVVYPEVTFELLITEKNEVADEAQVDSVVEVEETVSETPEAPVLEQTSQEDPAVESVVEETSGISQQEIPESPVISGNSIVENSFIAAGSASKDNIFTYNLNSNEEVSIVSNSVKYLGEPIEDSFVTLDINDGKAIVSSSYYVIENGFGEDYLGDYGLTIPIEVEDLDLIAEQNVLKTQLVYKGEVLAESQKGIELVDFNLSNVQPEEQVEIVENTSQLTLVKEIPTIRISPSSSYSLDLNEYFENAELYSFVANNVSAIAEENILILTPDAGFKGVNKARIVASSGENNLKSNEFTILVSSGAINIQTIRSDIKIGEKVKWIKNISLEVAENVTIELPKEAENISVIKVEESNVEKANYLISGQVVIDIALEKDPKIVRWFKKIFKSLTGNVIEEDLNNNEEPIEVAINDNAKEYVVEYYTEAPIANETLIPNGKEVIISAPDDLNYTDVLSFTNLPEVLNVGEESKLKLYWVENNSYLPFDAYDLNDNGKLDYVEWIVPHLSKQTFDLIFNSTSNIISECGNITEAGIYTLNQSINSEGGCIIIQNSNVILDGSGFSITGSDLAGSRGIYANGKDNLTIKNFASIQDFESGIFFNAETNSSVINNTLTSCTEAGIFFNDPSYNNQIISNTLTFNTLYGVYLSGDVANTFIQNNNFSYNNESGISFVGSYHGEVEGNIFNFNDYGIYLDGSNSNIIVNNTFNYGGGAIYLENSHWNNITNAAVTSCTYGLLLSFSNFTNVKNFIVSSSTMKGFAIRTSSYNIFENIVSSYNADDGLALMYNSTDNIIINASMRSNNGAGIWITDASANNTLLNIQFFNDSSGEIVDSNEYPLLNFLIYNNTFGEIKFIDSTFLQDLSINENITFPGDILIRNNSVYIDSTSLPTLNKSANITLYNTGEGGFTQPVILKDGVQCSDCYNFTSLNAGTVKFNVSSWSNYSIGDTAQLTSCSVLNQEGATYTLQNNINAMGNCFTISADNISINGAGKTVLGNGSGYGISASTEGDAYTNLTLINIKIINFSVDVFASGGNIDIYPVSAGNGADINLNNSVVGIINIDGGYVWDLAGMGGIANSGNGGSITIRNSNVTTINSSAGNIMTTADSGEFFGGNGGNVTIIDSIVENIISDGGGIQICGMGASCVAGDGGNIFVSTSDINWTGRIVRNSGGVFVSNGNFGNPGIFSINYTNSFYDGNTNYGNELKLKIIHDGYGEIDWSMNKINSSSTSSLSRNILIENNSVYTNSTALNTFNISANITLYGIGEGVFTQPVILKDGVQCSDCYNFTSLNAGTVKFNVSSWSNYSIGEGTISLFYGGDGSIGNPYQILNWTQLNNTRTNLTAYYILIANLSSSDSDYTGFGDNWIPIGTNASNNFSGSFNGNNKTISDLVINLPSSNYVGLFGYVVGNISNIGLLNVNITGYEYVGGLVGYSYGVINNSYSIANVSGRDTVGGLVGGLGSGRISNSYSTANIDTTDGISGGLVGWQTGGTIFNSYSTGNVRGSGYDVGGLVGSQDIQGIISNSYSTSNVTGSDYIGGLAGDSSGIINNSYSSGNVNGSARIGGLVGYQWGGNISNSYSTGNVRGSGDFIGGLVGYQKEYPTIATISDSYSTGNVIGLNQGVGGLAGFSGGNINNSYSIANVTGSYSVGGLVGYRWGGNISNSYSIANVTGSDYIGGLIGTHFDGEVYNSYSSGNVFGSFIQIGGLAGYFNGIVFNSSSRISGIITGNSSVGALIGYFAYGSVINSSAIVETSAIINGTSDVGFIGVNEGAEVTGSYMTIRNTTFGNITFLEWNVTGTGNILGNITIGNNSVYVNSAQAGLNKSANITLQGLPTFTNPVIYRDGVNVCNSTTSPSCYNFTSLNAGTVKFNVSSWSNYSIGEGASSGMISECQNLDIENTYYKLINNVSSNGTCFTILANNITLDGNGYEINYSINGTLGYGVYSSYNYTTIKNVIVIEGNSTTNSKSGIYIVGKNVTINNNLIRTTGIGSADIHLSTGAASAVIQNNNLFAAGSGEASGVYVYGGHGVLVENNSINTVSSDGIDLLLYSNHVINNNTIVVYGDNKFGIHIGGSALITNITFSGNKINTSNSIAFMIEGATSYNYNLSIDTSNLAEGKPVNYTYNADNLVFDGVDFTPYGQVIFAWSRNITVKNSNFSDDSLCLFGTNMSKIENNFINTSKGYGITFYSTFNNNLTSNTIFTSGNKGIGIYGAVSSRNNINNNIITTFGSSYARGIYLKESSDNNSINNNMITTFEVSADGIVLHSGSNGNFVNNNTILTSGTYGNGIYLSQVLRNVFSNNMIDIKGDSADGFFITSLSSHNIFINDTIIAHGSSLSGINLYPVNNNNNTFSGMKVYINNSNPALRIYQDNNFTMSNSILNSSLLGLGSVFIQNSSNVTGSGIWNFTNVTDADGNPININWSAGDVNATLNMHWWLNVYANYTNSSVVSNANITVFDVNGKFIFSSLTDSNGFIVNKPILEYVRNSTSGTNYTYYSNYTINATNPSSLEKLTQSWNMSSNTNLVFTFTLAAEQNTSLFAGGDGTSGDPYQILNWTQLNNTRTNLTAYYILIANLSSSDSDYTGFGDNWIPIGTNASNNFSGSFNGNNKTISDLVINLPSSNYVGLFGYNTGNIFNLGLINVNISALFYVGGLVGGQNGATISNSYATGSVSSSLYSGVLVGYSREGTISNSYSTGSVSATAYTGGLVGYQYDTLISNSYSTAKISNTDESAGGLVGYQLSGNISNSYSTGNVTSKQFVGGLVGYLNSGIIFNSSSIISGKISGNDSVGGLVGWQAGGTISNSSSRVNGTISGNDSVGGLVGRQSGSVISSFAMVETSAIVNGRSNVGFIGLQQGGTITNSYLIIINTTFGNITFLEWNVTGTGNILGNITIGNNSVYVNSAQAGLNKSANITLQGLPTFTNPVIYRDGVNVCNSTTSPSCYNFTSLNAGTVKFNVSSWSNYSIGEGYVAPVSSESEITLNSGWNMIALTMKNNDSGTDRNISVSQGWNLIGFSSDTEISFDSLTFTNSSGSKSTWTNAAVAKKVQKYMPYYDSAVGSKRYKFSSVDSSDLESNKGYWVWVNESGNITIPSVGGSLANETYKLSDLRFRNSSGAVLNISNATSAGWIEPDVWYWNPVGGPLGTGAFDYIDIPDNGDRNAGTINPWEGLFIWSNKENITLLREN